MTKVNKPKKVTFRQTLNVTWKQWELPKRLDGKDIWVIVDNLNALITKQDGIGMALWRLQVIMDGIKDNHNKPIWKTKLSKRKRVTIDKNLFSVWTLTCTRVKRDMSGGM